MIARGSIFEIKSHITIAKDLEYVPKNQFDIIDSRYSTLTRRLNSFVAYLKKK
jgi:four helix bundle protein